MSSAPIVDRIRIIPRPRDFLTRNVGSSGEVFFDGESKTLRVYSGNSVDRGGFEIARADLSNVDTSNLNITNDDINWIPYAELTDLPSAVDNHGMFAHVHGTGKAYYAHAGNWVELANQSDIPTIPVIPSSLLDLGITDGTLGQLLTTDGSGNFSFTTIEQGGGASVDVGLTPPAEPQQGNIWYDLNTGKIYVYVDDGDTSQWVQPVATSPTFSGDYNDLINKPTFGDSGFDGSFDSLTGTPTTLTGYGITDAVSTTALTLAITNLRTTAQTITGDYTFQGLTTLQQTSEVLSALTSATGVVTHDLDNGAVFYHDSMSADFTANFTNVPTTANRTISVVLILSQGGTAYIPTAVQIDGAAQTINWQGASVPSGNANQFDIVSFTLIRTGAAWTVIGSLTTYG